MAFMLTRLLWIWPVGTLNTLVYVAPVYNEQALQHRNVDACHTICNYPDTFELMLRSIMRAVEACIGSHGGHFEDSS
jgi:hypothetical protein